MLTFGARMTAGELIRLSIALDIPSTIKTTSGHVFSALTLLRARFRSSGDIYELVTKYDRPQSAISEIINYLYCFLDDRRSHLLDFDHEGVLSPRTLSFMPRQFMTMALL
jgi:hypothetical protein